MTDMQGIDMKILKRLRKFMDDASLAELEVEMEGVKVRLKKTGSSEVTPTPVALPLSSLPPTASSAPAPVTPGGEPAGSGVASIKSPMVGTFYRSPSPQSPPFVNAGDAVQEGHTLCLIEAMKLMNEIKAERAGKISKILVENGQPVEFDQPLFEFIPDN